MYYGAGMKREKQGKRTETCNKTYKVSITLHTVSWLISDLITFTCLRNQHRNYTLIQSLYTNYPNLDIR